MDATNGATAAFSISRHVLMQALEILTDIVMRNIETETR